MTASSKLAGMRHLVSNWQDRELDELLVEYPYLEVCAKNLLGRYQVPVEAGLMIGCAALTAAAGGSFRLRAPYAKELCPALHLLVASNRSLGIHFGVLEIFDPILKLVRSLVAENQKEADACVASLEEHSKTRKSFAANIEKKAAEYRAMVLGRCGIDLDRDLDAVRFFGPEYHQDLEAASSADAEAKRSAVLAKFIRRPGSVVEAIHPRDWLVPEAYAGDRAMFNLDPCGATWRELLAECPAVRRKIAHKLVAGSEGGAFRYASKTAPIWHLSSLSAVPPSMLQDLLANTELRETGLADRFITIEAHLPERSVGEFKPGAADPTFGSLLTTVHEFRLNCDSPVVWPLSSQAEQTFLQFLADLGSTHDDRVQGTGDTLVKLVLNLCIWLRLGAKNGVNETEPIGVEELRNAIAVACHVAGNAPVLHKAKQEDHWLGFSDPILTKMLQKIERKGEITHRELYRSFHAQRRDYLRPVLERGLSLGVIADRDGLLSIPSNPSGCNAFVAGSRIFSHPERLLT